MKHCAPHRHHCDFDRRNNRPVNIERMPDHPVRQFSILGIALAETDLDPAASSAPQRLLLAMDVALNPLRLQAPD